MKQSSTSNRNRIRLPSANLSRLKRRQNSVRCPGGVIRGSDSTSASNGTAAIRASAVATKKTLMPATGGRQTAARPGDPVDAHEHACGGLSVRLRCLARADRESDDRPEGRRNPLAPNPVCAFLSHKV